MTNSLPSRAVRKHRAVESEVLLNLFYRARRTA
jgi:hypothetical protein